MYDRTGGMWTKIRPSGNEMHSMGRVVAFLDSKAPEAAYKFCWKFRPISHSNLIEYADLFIQVIMN